MAQLDISAIRIGELSVSKKGAKSAALTGSETIVTWAPESQMGVVFKPSAYNAPADANRVNLVLRPYDEVCQQVAELDEAIISLAAKDSEHLFGKVLSEASVRERYTPMLHDSSKGYAPTLKLKYTKTGPGCTRLWDEEKRPRGEPEDWMGCSCRVKLRLKNVWFMGTQFGVTAEAQDLLIYEQGAECPL